MDGGRKKRKMGQDEDEDEEDDEEKSVQKFFALIRSTREARNQLLGHGDASKHEERKRGGEEKTTPRGWTPAFEPEDFMDGSQAKGAKDFLGIQAGPSGRKEEEKEETKGENGGSTGLDLSLSL